MAEDTSSENLRKFLESDDPALVMMGLSLAKGSRVPEELLPTILGLYMWDDDKSVRGAAKSVFNKHAPAEIQAKVEENWIPSYRTLLIYDDKFAEAIRQFLEAFKSQDVVFSDIALEPLIKALGDEDYVWDAVEALGKIGELAVEPLIRVISDKGSDVREYSPVHGVPSAWAAEALGKIGDARAVEPLIKALEDEDVRSEVAEALGKIGDARAVEPLIKVLSDSTFGNQRARKQAAGALGEIGDERAVEPLIEALKVWGVNHSAAYALGKIGDERAVEPLIKALSDESSDVRRYAAGSLGEIGEARAVEPLIKVLSDDEEGVRGNAARALGAIGDRRAVEPLIKTLEDDNPNVRWLAKEALKKLGHEVE